MELQIIQQKIFEIRGQKVMFDFDLAALYEVETKVFNQTIRRNIDRFPEEFMFQLTKTEFESLRSQFVTSNRGGTRYMPYAFTEHGITMAASILRSEKAVKMNIAIVRAFIALRKFAAQYGDIIEQMHDLRERIGNHDAQLNQIYEALENLLDEKVDEQQKKDTWTNRERIGFKTPNP
jgi:phage regulator Rha-like protein